MVVVCAAATLPATLLSTTRIHLGIVPFPIHTTDLLWRFIPRSRFHLGVLLQMRLFYSAQPADRRPLARSLFCLYGPALPPCVLLVVYGLFCRYLARFHIGPVRHRMPRLPYTCSGYWSAIVMRFEHARG